MRQISALMPAEKTALRIVLRQRAWRRALAFDQVAHARIVGWTGQSLGLHSSERNLNELILARTESGRRSATVPGRSNSRMGGRVELPSRCVGRALLCPGTGTLRWMWSK